MTDIYAEVVKGMTPEFEHRFRLMKFWGAHSNDAHDGFIAGMKGETENPFSIVDNVIRNRQWAKGREYATSKYWGEQAAARALNRPTDESPSYRAAMIDAGRGRLLR